VNILKNPNIFFKIYFLVFRGVVKFFNVCNQEQKEIENKLSRDGLSERKRDKILGNLDKGSFLDRLKKDEEDSENEDDDEDEGASDQEVF
jgi:hypothetical protein